VNAFHAAEAILREGIAARAFPGTTYAVLYRGQLSAGAIGRFTYDDTSPAVQPSTMYDLASLTKVVATTSMAMLLHDRGQLDLGSPVAGFVPEFGSDTARQRITLEMLLRHTSGLPAYVRLFEKSRGKQEMLRGACGVPLEAAPGVRATYSDIGFILLGAALERIAGQPLDEFCQREIFSRLGMKTMFRPPDTMHPAIPPTEDDRHWRQRVIQGEVHDENASAMGGVAGHAGLFGSIADLARFGEFMLGEGEPLVSAETVRLFTTRGDTPPGNSFALGWDTPTPPSQSGQYFSARAYGHLGFTGTSLWIDPQRELAVVLLTNRTWPDRRSQAIKQFRPQFHDAVVKALS
jgi:CubicO group peptidase (beta-lactamase class C family)